MGGQRDEPEWLTALLVPLTRDDLVKMAAKIHLPPRENEGEDA